MMAHFRLSSTAPRPRKRLDEGSAAGENMSPSLMPEKAFASAKATLALLMEGNRRFSSGKLRHPHQFVKQLPELCEGQHPKAIVLGCADSRVPIEILFDVGLGDIFDIRVAGNVIAPSVLGSMEFGVAELNIPLILVIGHTHCGAVSGAYEAVKNNQPSVGNLGMIIDAIRPSIRLDEGSSEECIAAAVHRNISTVTSTIRHTPGVLADTVAAKKLHVLGGCYSLETGEVEIFDNIAPPF